MESKAGNSKNGTVGSTGNFKSYISNYFAKKVFNSAIILTTIEYYQYFTFAKLISIKWDFI